MSENKKEALILTCVCVWERRERNGPWNQHKTAAAAPVDVVGCRTTPRCGGKKKADSRCMAVSPATLTSTDPVRRKGKGARLFLCYQRGRAARVDSPLHFTYTSLSALNMDCREMGACRPLPVIVWCRCRRADGDRTYPCITYSTVHEWFYWRPGSLVDACIPKVPDLHIFQPKSGDLLYWSALQLVLRWQSTDSPGQLRLSDLTMLAARPTFVYHSSSSSQTCHKARASQ